MLTLAAIFWGGTWVTGKLAVAAIPPITLAAIRFAIASVLLWLWVRAKGAPAHRWVAADAGLILAMGLTAVAGYNILFLYGLRLATASDGAIIVPGFTPILTMALAWPALRERPTRAALIGLAVALIGLIALATPGPGQTPSRLLGDLLFFLGAGTWAIYTIIGRRAIARFNPLRATLYGSVAGALLLLPFALAEGGWRTVAAAPAAAWGSLLYLATFATVLTYVFYYEGVKRIGAVRASTFGFLVPVFGVVSSMIVLGERLRTATAAGGALVLLGLWLVQRRPDPAPSAGAAEPKGAQ